ncbi:MAG TPA: phosphoglycerate mutase family protein [Gemmatimonadaceae bacterium]|nr:phosphoglycerate mutase family protein [Gemmatimonadaceae bacterium]
MTQRLPVSRLRRSTAALALALVGAVAPLTLAGAQQAQGHAAGHGAGHDAEHAAHLAATTTVILVRHAERAGEPAADPGITPAGEARARSLVQVVKDAGVGAIVTTQFQRTKLTAQPAAEALGITPEVVAASGQDHPQAVARYIKEKHAGKTVLVVGHSNTINAIALALGAPHPGVIEDSVYDNLFVVTFGMDGKGRLVKARY